MAFVKEFIGVRIAFSVANGTGSVWGGREQINECKSKG